MNRILQCRKVPILAPRRFFHPKRVGKIDEIKEILRVKIHSLKEAGKNFILNHKIAYLSFRATLNLAFMFTVGYITYISDLKLEDHFPWLEKFFPERYETLKKGLTEGIAVPGFPASFKLYEKEALIAGIVTTMQLITAIPRNLGSIALFQPLAEWAGSSQKRIKQLRVRCVVLYVVANVCAFASVIFFRYSIQSSESLRMVHFYNSVKRKRDRKVAYEIALAGTIEAENFKDDFDQIWNLDDEIFNQIDIDSNEDIKTQIHRLQQNTVTETTQDE